MKPVFVLLLFILLRGMEGNVLKLLQRAGGDLISFCNVFFFSSLITGVVMLLLDRTMVKVQLPQLPMAERWLLGWQGFLGYFLGPVGFYLALEHLSVVTQTLLFSLTVPLSTLTAKVFLKERLPKQFPFTLALISAGVVLGSMSTGGVMSRLIQQQEWQGWAWGSVAVIAFAIGGVLNRICSSRGMGVGLTVGVGSAASAVLFAILALIVYGPTHFMSLQLWWVMGVIGLYGISISLGSQWTLMKCYQYLGAAQISLWGSLTVVVALVGAHLFLGEPLEGSAILGASMILAALLIHQLQRT